MTKVEMVTLLRSVGVNENTVTAMENAFDLGVEHGRAEFRMTGDRLGDMLLYTWQGDEA